MDYKSLLESYLEQGLIRTNTKNGLTIVCYSRKAMGDSNWSEFLLKSRGLVLDNDYNPVNSPFEKIFNIGENELVNKDEIENRLATEKYEVYEKLNGHLIQMFFYDGQWIVCTKGSFDMEFIQKDREILQPVINKIESLSESRRNYYRSQTLLFEMLVDFDKHLLHGEQTGRYGNNTAVLIGIRSVEGKDLLHSGLCQCGNEIGVPVVNLIDKDVSLTNDYKLEGIEGYIVRFKRDGFRFKIKTDWYVNNRYVSKIDRNKLIKLFKQYGDSDIKSVYEEIPEECIYLYNDFIAEYEEFCEKFIEEAEIQLTNVEMALEGTDDISKVMKYIDENVEKEYHSAVKSLFKGRKVNKRTLKSQFLKSVKG